MTWFKDEWSIILLVYSYTGQDQDPILSRRLTPHQNVCSPLGRVFWVCISVQGGGRWEHNLNPLDALDRLYLRYRNHSAYQTSLKLILPTCITKIDAPLLWCQVSQRTENRMEEYENTFQFRAMRRIDGIHCFGAGMTTKVPENESSLKARKQQRGLCS